jgi:signal transduction histidine kinase
MAAQKTVARADVVVAGVVGVWAVYYLRPEWSPGAAAVVVLAAASALVWRRPRACLCLAVAAVATAALVGVGITAGGDEWSVAMALLAAASLGAFERPRGAVTGVLLLALSISLTADRAPGSPAFDALELLWPALPLGGVAGLAGMFADARRRSCAQRARVTALAADSPQEVARLAVVQERERLLVDVHTVLRAAVSSMLAHAEAASQSEAVDPRAALADLRAVQRVGRTAITELRVVLGQLRAATPPDPGLAPDDPGRPRIRRFGFEWALPVGLVVVAVLEPWIWGAAYQPGQAEPKLLTAALSAAAAAAVALRHLHPAAGAAGLGVYLAVSGLVGAPVMLGIAVFTTILVLVWWALALVGIRALAGVAVLLGGVVFFVTSTSQNAELEMLLEATLATAVVSYATAHHRGSADSTAAQAAALTRQRLAASAEAVRAQRLSVARELHDVVSHAVVVMTLQAGGAETLLLLDPEAARAALAQVRTAGAATLTELDALFAALRSDNTTGPEDSVNHDIPALVQRMRAGGLAVDLDATLRLPADPLVFRVVQETLTNTLRHAPTATVQLRIDTNELGTTVEAVDDGPGPVPGAVHGYGLVGITERVEHAGGRVEAGPGHQGRGFRVVARIPATSTPAAAT